MGILCGMNGIDCIAALKALDEKHGKQRLDAVAQGLKSLIAANESVLELGCCSLEL